MTPTHQNARERAFQARMARRAAEAAGELLAPALKRYALAEDMTWQTLAASLGCTTEALDRIGLCYPPRPDQFVDDVTTIAGDLIPPERLLPLLRRLQVLDIFSQPGLPSTYAETDRMLLAARDREDAPSEESEPCDG